MKKNVLIVISALIFLLFLTGCDQINGLVELIPSFDENLPNVFSGIYTYYENETDSGYTEYIEFEPVEKTFTYDTSDAEPRTGKYEYTYSDFQITQCNGYLTLNFDDGEVITYGFLFESTAIEGPTRLTLRLGGEDTVFEFRY